MMQSKSAPCRKGDEIRDYEAVANLPEAGLACDALLRGSTPSYADRLHDFNNKNVGPAAPVITGEVVVNATGNHEGVPLSAGVIAAVCISGFVVLFMCLCLSEIMSSLSRLRTRHSTSIFNRQHVHDDHSRAAPEGHVEVSSSNPTEVAGSKHRLARWVIKGLPIIKYKKQKVLQPGLTMSTNSASSAEFRTGQDNSRNAGTVIAPAALNHEMESALPSEAMYIDATPADSNRLECVVCLSPFEEDEAVRVLPQCCHTFHAVCIDSWLLLHSTCPLCRMQISSLDVEHDEEPARASYVIELCNTTSSY